MQIRHSTHPAQLPDFDTDGLRQRYLVGDLFAPGEIRTVYPHEDRILIGGATPSPGTPLKIESAPPLHSAHFCERRELIRAQAQSTPKRTAA